MVLLEFVAYESNAKVKHLGLIQCLGNIFLDPKGILLPMYPLKEFRLRHLGKEWVNHSWKLLGIESQGMGMVLEGSGKELGLNLVKYPVLAKGKWYGLRGCLWLGVNLGGITWELHQLGSRYQSMFFGVQPDGHMNGWTLVGILPSTARRC